MQGVDLLAVHRYVRRSEVVARIGHSSASKTSLRPLRPFPVATGLAGAVRGTPASLARAMRLSAACMRPGL